MSDLSPSETPEPAGTPLTPARTLAIIGLGLCSAVFLGALFIGMSIHPQVDMQGRLLAYTTAMAGLTAAFACRWALATGPFERKFCAGITLATLALTVVYGFVML